MTHAEALQALSKLEEDNVTSANSVFIMHPTNYSTIAATAGTVVLGNYSHCIIGMFGGTDIVVDNMTEARSAKVLITQHQMADVAILHAVAFCAITLTV